MALMKSWVESANSADTEFPLNNLPYGVFMTADDEAHCCVAIGDMILDLAVLEDDGVISVTDEPVFDLPFLNEFMDAGKPAWDALRARLMDLLSEGGDDTLRGDAELQSIAMAPRVGAEMAMPFVVAEYTDFYAGRHHATNVGTMFRGAENALPPNWLHIPIGYNGRASTVVVSGTDIIRPNGQLKGPGDEVPRFGPCARLDIELEMGAVVGTGNAMGQPVSVAEADDMIFGYVLLNDWSARDIQAWEYQPLGPFQAKAFGTSISPWVVTKAALEPFRTSTPAREEPLLPHLQEPGPMLYDIDLAVTMRPEGAKTETVITRTNYNQMYYSSAQQLCHHASSGCAMNSGDLLGSGTISGPEKHERGSLLEISWGGKEPFTLDSGETRSFLEDGDTMTLKGAAKGEGYQIGFGDCVGKILPAVKV
ncbi:MAG: fumarylacetoacetase [Rhodobacteraceae bacterium]|nr:fumarylacetoacetase [Paracoccaceae bacterium]